MRTSTTLRHLSSLALFLLGASLLLHVGWAYATMWHEQRVLAEHWQQVLVQAAAPGAPMLRDEGGIRLMIPQAEIDAMVLEGVRHRQLALGPGHLPSTPLPGEVGNAVVSAHRDTFFRKIVRLHPGDEILVRRSGQIYHFSVTGQKIVEPNDLSVMSPTPDAQLTLITCYPIYFVGPAPKRLIITSRLTSTEPDRGSTLRQSSR